MASADPTRLVELAAVSAVHGNLFYAKHLFHRAFVWSGICYRLLVDSNHSAGIASGCHAADYIHLACFIRENVLVNTQKAPLAAVAPGHRYGLLQAFTYGRAGASSSRDD